MCAPPQFNLAQESRDSFAGDNSGVPSFSVSAEDPPFLMGHHTTFAPSPTLQIQACLPTTAILMADDGGQAWTNLYQPTLQYPMETHALPDIASLTEIEDNSNSLSYWGTSTKLGNARVMNNSTPSKQRNESTEVVRQHSKERREGAHSEEPGDRINKMQSHCAIERRYRDKLNNNMSLLYNTLLEAKQPSRLSGFRAFGEGNSQRPPNHIKKAEIINEAINYIRQAEVDIRHMASEISHLQACIQMLERQHRLMTPAPMSKPTLAKQLTNQTNYL